MDEIKYIFDFFRQLKYNNNVDWMHTNKKTYENARDAFYALGDKIINQLSLTDPSIAHQTAKDSSFRLARDTRFSANKLPYHTHFGLLLTPQGKMSAMAGYFIYLQPNDEDGEYFSTTMIGAGIYAPPARLAKIIREAIDDEGEILEQYLLSDTFKNSNLQLIDNEKLRALPKQWKESPHQELIKLKHWMLAQYIDEKEVESDNFINKVVNTFRAAHSWNSFLNQTLIENGENLSWKNK